MKAPDLNALKVTVGSVALRNPVLLASGTASFGAELHDFGMSGLGGIVLKTVTPEARQGNPPPRIAETPAGMLNAIGLENPGLDAVISSHLPALARTGCALVVSLHADNPGDLNAMVSRLTKEVSVAAVEVNLSCPNVAGGTAASDDKVLAHEYVCAAVAAKAIPVWAKVSPESPCLLDTVTAAQEAGAEAVVVANTYRGTAVDWRTSTPLLGRGSGGLSGPAIRPLALLKVALVARETDLPVVASGGIFCAEDVMQFLAVGAQAVEIGTANFVDPGGVCRIPEELARLLSEEGIEHIHSVIGTTSVFPDFPAGKCHDR